MRTSSSSAKIYLQYQYTVFVFFDFPDLSLTFSFSIFFHTVFTIFDDSMRVAIKLKAFLIDLKLHDRFPDNFFRDSALWSV